MTTVDPDAATPPPETPPPAAAPTTLDNIVSGVEIFVSVATPIAELADPALIPAITLGSKLLTGVLAAEPSAVALWSQFKAGTPPTPAQLAQWSSDYETDYTALKTDVDAALAALPPGA